MQARAKPRPSAPAKVTKIIYVGGRHIGGSGPVNAQIGDSDTGGAVVMGVHDSIIVASEVSHGLIALLSTSKNGPWSCD